MTTTNAIAETIDVPAIDAAVAAHIAYRFAFHRRGDVAVVTPTGTAIIVRDADGHLDRIRTTRASSAFAQETIRADHPTATDHAVIVHALLAA